MRGICGFFHIDGQPVRQGALQAMQAALALTPWSSANAHASQQVGLAAVQWGMQPRPTDTRGMASHPQTGCVVITDAHLCDKPALAARLQLAADHPDAHDDAALILHAWLRWQVHAPEHLDGEFAFAVHDPRQQTLFLARDRMGVRPLYLHLAQGRLLVFASSAEGVLAHPEVPRTLNEARIADFLVNQLEGVDKRCTFHAHVQRLPPAHWLRVDRAGVRQERYWSLGDEPPFTGPRDDDAWAEALKHALDRAVSHHLAGHSAGAMVSGGMDSSSLAALAATQRSAAGMPPLHIYSLVDSRSPNPETHAVLAMAALPGVAPRLLDHETTGAIAEATWRCAWQCDEPFDALMLPLHAPYWAAAQDGIDAVIDGVDGDIPFLIGNGLARRLRRGHAWATWRNVQGLARTYPMGPTAPRQFAQVLRGALTPDRLRILRRSLHPNRRSEVASDSPIHPEFAQHVQLQARLDRLADWGAELPHWSPRREACELLDHPFLTVALERYHRVAAHHGIQPLHPFLDRHCLALYLSLPDRQRLHDGWTKAVLRRAMARELPEAVLRRQDKQHLGWAQTQALLQSHHRTVVDQLQSQQGLLTPYVAPATLRRALATPVDTPAESDDWPLLFNLATLAHWLARQSQVAPHSTKVQEKVALRPK